MVSPPTALSHSTQTTHTKKQQQQQSQQLLHSAQGRLVFPQTDTPREGLQLWTRRSWQGNKVSVRQQHQSFAWFLFSKSCMSYCSVTAIVSTLNKLSHVFQEIGQWTPSSNQFSARIASLAVSAEGLSCKRSQPKLSTSVLGNRHRSR